MTIKSLILQLYEQDPSIVNDDNALTAAIWASQTKNTNYEDGIAFSTQEFERRLLRMLRLVTDQQTIKRRRRQLHEEGKIKYNQTTENWRFDQYKQNKEAYIPEVTRAPENWKGGNYED